MLKIKDEVGAAAILSIQLDDALGGDPVQHKETQDHESQAFLALFTPCQYTYAQLDFLYYSSPLTTNTV